MTHALSHIPCHGERSEAISHRLPRRSLAFTPRNDGFSLIELSIVLVILGLLTGGILTGQNLIRAAELRSVTTEFQAYQTAVNTFRDKYFALPGDMRNAHQFWGSAGGSGVIGDGCQTATGTGTQTCSGNGDGRINYGSGGEFNEVYTFWQHLANAGLIEGRYSGVAGAGGMDDAIIGTNVPPARVGNGGWSIMDQGDQVATSLIYYEGNYTNYLFLGTKYPSGQTSNPLVSAEEAWNIDTKIDDGKPGTGILRTLEDHGSATAGQGCANAAPAATPLATTVEYDLQNTSIACSLILKL